MLMGSGCELGIVEARNADTGRLELLQLVAQGSRADAEAFGGELAASAGDSQGGENQLSLTLFEVVIQTDLLRCGGGRRHFSRGPDCRDIPSALTSMSTALI